MEALSTTLSTRPALYIGPGLLAATLAIKVVAPALYNRLVFYLRMAVVFVYTVYAGTSTWLYGIRQERLAKEDGKKVWSIEYALLFVHFKINHNKVLCEKVTSDGILRC